VTALGVGRHGDAYEHLRRVFDPADPAYHPFIRCWAIGDLAEAAVHSGHRAAARAVLQELEPLAAQTPSSWFQTGMRYARPLLADDHDAEPLFQAALDADLTRWPVARARLQLAYGAWLRRQRRVAESRAPLRAAREAFDVLGVFPWGERARQELRAAGEASRRRAPEAWDQLTPQELQIAQLAANGLSNREIGQQLYLSHRTVGTHLYRVFPKLGITSRAQLPATLDGSARRT
jgi:DNA-binding CsgD family transcriptional regulator